MESRIFVQTARQNGRTQVEDMYFTAPYKIMRPAVQRRAIPT